jgi:DNA-binding response OmpR family regulator
MELKDVLIIENDEGMAHHVFEEFTKHEIKITHVTDDKGLEKRIKDNQYQMVILDWYLDEMSSDLARLCLEKIRQTSFLPVVIWTDELDSFNGEADDVYRIFSTSDAPCV